jgi:hypothetical protein
MPRPARTAAQMAQPRERGRFAPKGMLVSLGNARPTLVELDPQTPIYNQVLADLSRKGRKR